MEIINKVASKGRIEDSSSLVKAAAWAWYQRGSSGSSHETRTRMTTEYRDASSWKTTERASRPSRYKLEAMKQQVQEKSQVSHLSCLLDLHNLDDNDDPQSLLDSYEIRRISRDLNCFIEATHAKSCENPCCPYKTLSSGTRSISNVGRKRDSFDASCKNKGEFLSQEGDKIESGIRIERKERKSRRGFGFGVRRSSTVICGAKIDDVVDVRVNNDGSRLPEKHVLVVNVSICRPHRI